MKGFLFLLSLVLLISGTFVRAQSPQDNVIVSDEFHFMAVFPEKPNESKSELKTRFGTGSSHLWVVQRPDISYEVSVTDFADLKISMDPKSLMEFYDSICEDIAVRFGNPHCAGGGIIIGNDHGRNMSFGNGTNETTGAHVWIAQKRLYLVSVTVKRKQPETDNSRWKEINAFLDDFLLIQKSDDEKRYRLGLPTSASQNPKSPN